MSRRRTLSSVPPPLLDFGGPGAPGGGPAVDAADTGVGPVPPAMVVPRDISAAEIAELAAGRPVQVPVGMTIVVELRPPPPGGAQG